jgi:hypothetical protein
VDNFDNQFDHEDTEEDRAWDDYYCRSQEIEREVNTSGSNPEIEPEKWKTVEGQNS